MVSEKLIQKAAALLDEIAAEEYRKGYDAAKAEEGTAPDPAPVEPVIEGFDAEAAKANLTALRGSASLIVAIMDARGLVYADADAWKEAGSPEVLGIAYQDSSHTLLMHPKRVAAAEFGGGGITFGKKVFTSTVQWLNSQGRPSAFEDATGVSNTEGIIEGCSDSLAAKCAGVTFANGQKGYMPAAGELRLVCKRIVAVDALLEAVGGDTLKWHNGAHLMHSSSCRNATTVWNVRYSKEGDAQPAYRAKTSKCPTRVFMKL